MIYGDKLQDKVRRESSVTAVSSPPAPRTVFLTAWGREVRGRVWAGLVSPEASLPGVQTAVSSLSHLMASPLRVSVS